MTNGQASAPKGENHLLEEIREEEHHRVPATFTLLYESRDGRLCLFEDSAGHLTAVRADRFV